MSLPYAEVIGDPIAHSKSPLIHKFWLKKLGLNYAFQATQVGPDELRRYFEARLEDPRWCGCSVTLPHKRAAARQMTGLEGAAKSLNVVNCVTRTGSAKARLIGYNSDVAGFIEPLQIWLAEDRDYRFADVLGTGGAAAAVSYALDRADVTVASYGRSWRQARDFRLKLQLWDDDLAQEINRLARPGASPEASGSCANLLVNATPLGMTGFSPLHVNLDLYGSKTLVYDLVYSPVETDLLREARARGMKTVDGLTMLVGQAATAFELFYMEPAPRQHDAELRELLTR